MSLNELVSRIRSHWPLKVVFSVILTVGFPGVYFGLLQRYPMFPVTVMTESRLDRMIPLIPDAVYLYESIWLLMPIAPWLLDTRDQLLRYSTSFAVMSGVGFFIFFFFPTAIPRPRPHEIYNTNALYEALLGFDRGINACPSFHAAFAIFHAACCHAIFTGNAWNNRIRWGIWIWVTGILVSTLLTKQHVLIDIVAGSLLGFGGFAVYRFRPVRLRQQEERLHEQASC